tara:strand:- start:8007 stop:8174 length:168 start_codon:yes stop_codon:yes gene_type:complete
MSHRYILPIEEDEESGELLLNLPDELLDEMGWYFGDELEYSIEDDQLTLRKFKEP